MFQRLLFIACGIGCLCCTGLNTAVAVQENSANPLRSSLASGMRTRESNQQLHAESSGKTPANDEESVDATEGLKLEALTKLYPTKKTRHLSEVVPQPSQNRSDRPVIPIEKQAFPISKTPPSEVPDRDIQTSPSKFNSTIKPFQDHGVVPTAFQTELAANEVDQLAVNSEPLPDLTTHNRGTASSIESAIDNPSALADSQSTNRPNARSITLGEFLNSPETTKDEPGEFPAQDTQSDGKNQVASNELPFSGHSIDFMATLQKIATGTCLVLFLGVGFILVAKRFSLGKSAAMKSTAPKLRGAETPLSFRLLGNFKLDTKSSLQIIEVGDQKLLIANDATGIKSVVPIGNSFANSLDDLASAMSENSIGERDESVIYTPSARLQTVEQPGAKQATSTQPSAKNAATTKTNSDVEDKMRRQLAELLGGQAFKDVFYQQTKATP